MKKLLILCSLVTTLAAMEKPDKQEFSEELEFVQLIPARPERKKGADQILLERINQLGHWANNHPAQTTIYILGSTFTVGTVAGLVGYYLCQKNNS